METKYPVKWIRGLANCQNCNTRGNVCMDSDGVYRCHWCSDAKFIAVQKSATTREP